MGEICLWIRLRDDPPVVYRRERAPGGEALSTKSTAAAPGKKIMAPNFWVVQILLFVFPDSQLIRKLVTWTNALTVSCACSQASAFNGKWWLTCLFRGNKKKKTLQFEIKLSIKCYYPLTKAPFPFALYVLFSEQVVLTVKRQKCF